MSAALVRGGAEVVQATTVSSGSTPRDDGLPWIEDGVAYRYFRRSAPGSFHYSRGLGNFLRHSVRDFDVVHVEALFQYPTIPACSSARRAGVPYVLGPLGSLSQWSMQHRAWKKVPYFHLVERRHLEHAAALHANSEAESHALREAGFGHLVRLIPLGVDRPSTPARRSTRDGPLEVLFLSRLHAVKGLPLLLEALGVARARGTPARLTIAGAGEPAYERELRDRVRALGIGDAVRFAGHVEGTEKDALLRDADVFALTSFQESFGLAVAEAMAYALPVLITDRVGIERDVRESGAGIVTSVDVGEITRAISILASSSSLRDTMGERGMRLVAERYSWDRTASALLALYDEVAVRRAVASVPGVIAPAL